MIEIMLVDDDTRIRSSIKAAIDREAAGFRIVSEASGGNEALQLLEQGPLPKLIISDTCMAEMDGIEFIRICRERYPLLRTVVLSGYSDCNDLKSAIQLGVKDFLLKPVMQEELKELLGKLGEELAQEQKSRRASRQELLRKNGQLRKLQENYLLHMLKEEWYSLPAIRARLVQLQLAPLTAEELRLQFAAVEMRVPEGRQGDREERRELLKLVFQMLCRETSAEWKGIYPFGDDFNPAMMYFLVILKPGPEHDRKTQRFMNELKHSVTAFLKLECATGIGEEVQGLKRLKNGYSTCMLDLSLSTVYLSLEGEGYRSMQLQRTFTQELERNLARAIEHPDMNAFRQHLDAVFSSKRDSPMCVITFLALRLLLLFTSIATKYEQGSSSVQKHLWNLQLAIADYQSREGLRSLMDELARLVMEEVKKTRFSNDRHRIEAVRKYAGQHFSYELEPSSLAAMFHFNEEELIKLFKQHVGTTFSDYVARLRIAMAEQLLQDDELKLADISALAGYSSFGSFSAVFKKFSGTSPKEYRERYLRRQTGEWRPST